MLLLRPPSSLELQPAAGRFWSWWPRKGINRQRFGLTEKPHAWNAFLYLLPPFVCVAFACHMQLLCLFWICTNQENRLAPSEWFRSIGHHCHTQLDGFADRKGQVFIPIAEVWGSKAIWEDNHTNILNMKAASTLPPFSPFQLLASHVNNPKQALDFWQKSVYKKETYAALLLAPCCPRTQ